MVAKQSTSPVIPYKLDLINFRLMKKARMKLFHDSSIFSIKWPNNATKTGYETGPTLY